MTRELLQQALDALDLSQSLLERSSQHSTILAAYTALAEAIAQPVQAQPVQPMTDMAIYKALQSVCADGSAGTFEEMQKDESFVKYLVPFARAIESAILQPKDTK